MHSFSYACSTIICHFQSVRVNVAEDQKKCRISGIFMGKLMSFCRFCFNEKTKSQRRKNNTNDCNKNVKNEHIFSINSFPLFVCLTTNVKHVERFWWTKIHKYGWSWNPFWMYAPNKDSTKKSMRMWRLNMNGELCRIFLITLCMYFGWNFYAYFDILMFIRNGLKISGYTPFPILLLLLLVVCVFY